MHDGILGQLVCEGERRRMRPQRAQLRVACGGLGQLVLKSSLLEASTQVELLALLVAGKQRHLKRLARRRLACTRGAGIGAWVWCRHGGAWWCCKRERLWCCQWLNRSRSRFGSDGRRR